MGKGYWDYIDVRENAKPPLVPKQNMILQDIRNFKDWNNDQRKSCIGSLLVYRTP